MYVGMYHDDKSLRQYPVSRPILGHEQNVRSVTDVSSVEENRREDGMQK